MTTRLYAIGSVIIGSFLLQGCEKIQSFFGPTSIKTFDKCIEAGTKGASTSKAAVKAACIERHQSSIPDVLEGKGSYEGCAPADEFERDSDGRLVIDKKTILPIIKNASVPRVCDRFEGTLVNNSAKYIVTSVKVLVRLDGSNQVDSITLSDLWIEKDKSSPFSFPVQNKPKKANSDDALKGRFSWWTESEKGFVVDY